MTVADALPDYDIRTAHGFAVTAPPEAALAAVRAVTPREAPLLRVLFLLRGLRAGAGRPIWDAMRAAGFVSFDSETLVAIGRPWRPWEGVRRVAGASGSEQQAAFRAFSEPGWAKLAVDFRAEGGRLVTETRVLLTDAGARRSFRRYWLVIGPFSGLVRRSWLAAARQRAERQISG